MWQAHIRQAVIEAQHAGLQHPEEGYIEHPAGQKALGTKHPLAHLLHADRGSLLVGEPGIGPEANCGAVSYRLQSMR